MSSFWMTLRRETVTLKKTGGSNVDGGMVAIARCDNERKGCVMGIEYGSTRRDFVKTAGAVAMGAMAARTFGMAAALADESTGNDAAQSIDEIVWDEEYDVVVVGGGCAGMVAAVVVATEGDGASCLLLEKGSSSLGSGNSIYSSGNIFIGEDADELFEYLKQLRGEFLGTPDEVLRAFANELPQHRAWLDSIGADDRYITNHDKDYAEWSEYSHSLVVRQLTPNDEAPDGLGHIVSFLDAKLDNECSETVTRLFNAPLIALIQNPDTKAVVGGIYSHEGKNVYVKASKGVIMCCGGFENDEVMKQDYLSMPVSHPAAGVCNTGDGHRICAKLGAGMWHMNSYAGGWNNAIKLDGSEMAEYRTLKKNQGISVGVNGRRYYQDWDGSTMYKDWRGTDMTMNYGCRHGHQNVGGDWASVPQPVTSWFIFDQNGLDQSAYLGQYASTNTVLTQMEVTEAEYEVDPEADGYGYKADTLEELAEKAGLPVEEFVKTIECWNAAVDAGEDEQFHRPSDTLVRIDTPPFYAVRCCPEVLNTDGGPRRNEHAQIVDVEGNPIPGLYSAGEFGSVWCDKYQGAGNLSECLAFGRIAARSALGA